MFTAIVTNLCGARHGFMGAMIQMHYIYCAVLFLLLWHQLHLRSSGIRSLEEFSTVCTDPGVLQSRGWKRVGRDWAIELNTFKAIGLINKAEVNVFLEFPCFFYDPMDVGNLISGSSSFYKSSLNIWKFQVHILLKPCLENFEHYSAGVWDECSCVEVWTFFGIALLWDWNKNWPQDRKRSVFNRVLLSHKKEHIWVSSNEVDESRAYYKVKLVRKQKIYIVY